jgi:hypothetical protein
MTGKNSWNGVGLDRGGDLVVAQTDVLTHDRVETSVIKLEVVNTEYRTTDIAGSNQLTFLTGLGRSLLSAMTSIFCRLHKSQPEALH